MHNERLIIRAQRLSKSYKKTIKAEGLGGSLRSLLRRRVETIPALNDFDLELAPGEMLGIIGPNGAGKTTLVKMLSGIIRPESGELQVLGSRPCDRSHAYLSRMALVMGQKSQLWWDLPASDSFLLNKAIYGIPEAVYRSSLGRLAASLEVEALLDAPVRTLSLGERMRMEFIAAMLHEPDIVFLDEPTIGLDAPAQKRIREFLRRENRERGMTLVLTSHYMDDIRLLCPRTLLILKDGRLEVGGMSLARMASYYLVAVFVFQFDQSSALSGELAGEIRSGLFGKYLARPVDPLAWFLAASAGRSLFQVGSATAAAIASAVVLALLRSLRLLDPALALAPVDLLGLLAAVPVVLSGLLSFALVNFMTGILAFAFQDVGAFIIAKNCVVEFLAGALVPLALLPAGAKTALGFTPFPALASLPADLVLGRGFEALPSTLVCLALWNLALFAAARALYSRLRLRYEEMGS